MRLPNLPGIQADVAVQRLGGDVTSYIALLDKFRNRNRGAVAEIRLALTEGDRKRAERIAHTLKSVAGTLGATSLQGKASDLEIRIRDDIELSGMERQLESANSDLLVFLAGIDQQLSDADGVVTSAAPPDAHLPSLIRSALDRLSAFDTSADEPIANVQSMLPTTGRSSIEWRGFGKCLSRYDDETARIELIALAEQLGIAGAGEPNVSQKTVLIA